MTFEDGRFYEGTVNQANRLMSSSSSQRYQENLARLGKQAEAQLGAAGVSGLVGGYNPMGITTGGIEAQRQTELGNTFTQLLGQQRQLNQYKQPIDFTSYNANFY